MDVKQSQAAARDVAAFGAAAREASTRLYRAAYLLSGDEHSAQELLQAAVERAYRRWWWGRSRQPPEVLVRRALARLAARRRRGHPETSAPGDGRVEGLLPDDAGESRPAESRPAESRPAVDPTDLDQVLVDGLLALSPRERTVLVLRYGEGLDEQQVAHELGWSLGSVQEHARRGLLQLHRRVLSLSGEGLGGRELPDDEVTAS